MPAPVVTRNNTITYGGFAMGGATEYHLHGLITLEQNYQQLTVSWQIFLQHDTDATFTTNATALEDAMRVPNGDLLITVDGNNWFNLTQSGNTGMNATPRIRKVGGGGDSNNSRVYDCSVIVLLPADETGKDGRQSSRVSLTEDGAEILTLEVEAVYTALSSNSALAQAQSAFPTYVGTLQTAAGGTWDELSARTYSHDSDNKVCRARAAYRQIPAGGAQSGSGANDTTLANVRSSVTTRRIGVSADPGGSEPLIEITVTYSCQVRSSVSTALRTVYESTVRPHMISIAQSLSGVSRVTMTREVPGLRPQDNSIEAALTFFSPGDTNLIRSDTDVSLVERMPEFYVPVLDGDPFSRDQHSRPGFKGATVVTSVLRVGSPQGKSFPAFDREVRRLTSLGYKVTEIQHPSDRSLEFDGMGQTAPLRIVSQSKIAILELAKVKMGGPSGSGSASVARTR